MKRLFFFVAGTIVGAASGVGFCGALPVAAGGDGGLTRCLAAAKLELAANPRVVTLGQSSRVSWSVTAPKGCGAVHVQLNREDVARSGAETVTPTQNTTFTLVADESHGGRSARKRASARVIVIYPLQLVIDRIGARHDRRTGEAQGTAAAS